MIALHAGGVLTERPAAGASSQIQIILPPEHPSRSVLEDLLAGAEETSIRVSPTIAPFLERRFTLAPLESASGDAGRVLLGLEPSGLGLAGRPLSRLVGRQDELGMLRALFERAESGQGQVVGLIGEPGVGKSRLVYEFRESLERPPVTYLEGHCLSSGSTTPYGPVARAYSPGVGNTELDTSSVITEKVGQHLLSLGIESETSAPYLLELLGVKTGAKPLDQPSARGEQAPDLRDVARNLAAPEPTASAGPRGGGSPVDRSHLRRVPGDPGQRSRRRADLLLMTYRPGSECRGWLTPTCPSSRCRASRPGPASPSCATSHRRIRFPWRLPRLSARRPRGSFLSGGADLAAVTER